MYVVRLERFTTYHTKVVFKTALVICDTQDEHNKCLVALNALGKRPRKKRVTTAGDITPFLPAFNGWAIYIRYRYDPTKENEELDWEKEVRDIIFVVAPRELSAHKGVMNDE